MQALRGTAAISGMILFIILGATTFAQILSFSGASNGLVQTITGQGLSTAAIVAAMMVMLIFLGIFVDQVSMMMITLPIFMPVVQTLGIDPVWFGVMYLICMQLGLLLPPHGLLLMTMRGVAPPQVRMGHIFAAVVPYVPMSLLLLAAVFSLPAIATWLPKLDRLALHYHGIHSSNCSLASVRCDALIGRMPATICLTRSRSISRARVARCSCASGLRSRLTSHAADTGPTLARALAQVHLRRALGAAHAVAPGREREVQLQDARLAERALHLHRVQQLAQLARGAAVVAGDRELGELLRQRAAATQGRAVALVVLPRREHLLDLIAGVLVRSARLRRRSTRAAASRPAPRCRSPTCGTRSAVAHRAAARCPDPPR